jgi:hypothetical protein
MTPSRASFVFIPVRPLHAARLVFSACPLQGCSARLVASQFYAIAFSNFLLAQIRNSVHVIR